MLQAHAEPQGEDKIADPDTPPPETVYFVGDTPESDIRGANIMDDRADDTEWYSILVKTGVYEAGTEPRYRPRRLVDTVLDAVNHGVRREMARQKRLPLDEAAMKAIAEGRTSNLVTRVGPSLSRDFLLFCFCLLSFCKGVW